MTWRRRKQIGHALVWAYWTSFAWLRLPFWLLGIRPQEHPWLRGALEIHYAPFMGMVAQVAPMFAWLPGWSVGIIWFAPVIAMVAGGLVCSGLWWVLARVLEQRSKVATSGTAS